MHPTSHGPLNCAHLEHASIWLTDQHKGLSCQALSPLPSSPGSSAGCIQGQLTDKTDLPEKHLPTLELLQKKTWKSHTVALGSPCYEVSVSSFIWEWFSSWGSHPWAPAELPCSSNAATPVPGHVPHWSESWPNPWTRLPGLNSILPCQYGLAWQALNCSWPWPPQTDQDLELLESIVLSL